jgi:hypothetical protein
LSALFIGFIFALALLACFIVSSLLHAGAYDRGRRVPVLSDHDVTPKPQRREEHST